MLVASAAARRWHFATWRGRPGGGWGGSGFGGVPYGAGGPFPMLLVPFGLFTPTGPVAVPQARVREGFAMCQARSKKQNEECGWEQGGEAGAAPVPGPRSWGTVAWGSHGPAPWRSSLATQLPWTAPQSAVPRMLTEGGKKKNILKRMYHLKAKITPGQTDGDTNPLTSPLSLDSPNRCLRYVTCFYTAWPKTSQRLFFAYLHSNGRVQTSTALKFNKQARRFKRVARRTHY